MPSQKTAKRKRHDVQHILRHAETNAYGSTYQPSPVLPASAIKQNPLLFRKKTVFTIFWGFLVKQRNDVKVSFDD